MAHAQKPVFVFRLKGEKKLTYFSGLLAAKLCTGNVERSCSALNTHSIPLLPHQATHSDFRRLPPSSNRALKFLEHIVISVRLPGTTLISTFLTHFESCLFVHFLFPFVYVYE
jgi:hypothetical protein